MKPPRADRFPDGVVCSEDAARARDGLLEVVLDELVERVAARVAELQSAPAEREPWRLLTTDEVAEALRRSSRWVRERVRRGDLVAVRLDGGGPLFALEDVQAFAGAHRIGNGQAEQGSAWWRP